ncbi:MAG: hypothetical protein M3548_20275 [Actinomycetota bacterium]|nr:hypothetical protein [Actinomycetota bacterium]
MRTPTIHPEHVVLGTLMQATPTDALPHLDRLDRADFADSRGAHTYDLMDAIVGDGVPSLDPATLLGVAHRNGDMRDTNHAQLLTQWVFIAYSTTVPLVALDFHITSLIEISYRRRIAACAARLAQIADHTPLSELDVHIGHLTTELDRHRARITATTTHPTAARQVRQVAA